MGRTHWPLKSLFQVFCKMEVKILVRNIGSSHISGNLKLQVSQDKRSDALSFLLPSPAGFPWACPHVTCSFSLGGFIGMFSRESMLLARGFSSRVVVLSLPSCAKLRSPRGQCLLAFCLLTVWAICNLYRTPVLGKFNAQSSLKDVESENKVTEMLTKDLFLLPVILFKKMYFSGELCLI